MFADNVGIGFAGVALVTYMSSLTSLGYTATQYALLSSAYTYVGKFAKGFSGVMVERLAVGRPLIDAYGLFFIGAGLLGVPALILCIFLARAVRKSARRPARRDDADGRGPPADGGPGPVVRALWAGPATAASLFDPLLRFRVLSTEHFVIHFHQGEERLAQRLAVIAEDTWIALERPLGLAPPRKTRVVLADQTELFNGYATPVPYNTVVMYAVTPSGSSSAFDDWLRLVFTHEFTHIVHLDRSEGWAHVARGIFGRRRTPFRTCFFRRGRSRGWRRTRRARSRAKAAARRGLPRDCR
jgi:hypothetical protein